MKKIFFAMILLFPVLAGKAQLKIGTMAPGISLPDTRDSIVNLSSLNGKIVLVDFWASWCMPCRAANPGLARLYNKYKGQGFEVFGISIDAKKEEWLKAIKKDKLAYTHVNENTGWYSKTAEQYLVDYLPTNYLLDRTGKIVGVNLEGKALENQVKGLLK